MLSNLSRRTRSRYARACVLGLLVIFLLDLFPLLSSYRTLQSGLEANTIYTANDLPAAVRNDKIYISAQFWTSAQALYKGWSTSLLELVEVLGPSNVFVSIVESGSLDNTKEFLAYLNYKLGELNVDRNIVTSNWSHADEMNRTNEAGVLHFPQYAGNDKNDGTRREWEIRRIPFLARERNRGMEPLQELGKQGRVFDKILVLNDVVFTAADVLSLLGTRQGRYSVACALDFQIPKVGYYDTFALRDSEWRESAQRTFPFFQPGETQDTMLAGMPSRVRSCWNGMVFMDAAPFYDTPGQPGLQYRAIEDSLAVKHVEGSECCLVWADMDARGEADQGLWVNPAVRVGYSQKAYDAMRGPLGHDFVSPFIFVKGIWRNRWIQWFGGGLEQPQVVRDRVAAWKREGLALNEQRSEIGDWCLIDEMHVLIWNGWRHI